MKETVRKKELNLEIEKLKGCVSIITDDYHGDNMRRDYKAKAKMTINVINTLINDCFS